MTCALCDDQRFTIKDGVKEVCPCVKMKRLCIYFPDALSALETGEKDADLILGIEFVPNTVCRVRQSFPESQIDLIKLAYLMSLDCPSYKVLNVYELIEIYLSRHPQFSSLFELKFPAVILTEGYNEFPNVRQNDAILQFLDIAKRHGGDVLFLSRKREVSPVLIEYFERSDWGVLDMTLSSGSDQRAV